MIRLFQVDAFTDTPFSGNPAAVCLLKETRPDSWLQAVAAEMNLSETAFLWPEHDHFLLRWFTPTTEVDLCGHATLAAAHVLWSEGLVSSPLPIRFQTHSGLLTAARTAAGIELDFPAAPPIPALAPQGLAEALGGEPSFVGKSDVDLLVVFAAEQDVRSLRPDFRQLAGWPVRGVIVTSRSASTEVDFVSRFFAPAAGIDEDPVTGSAHCALAPYWSERLGKNELVGYQASPRGGTVRVRLSGDRVILGGRAVTVMHGELRC